VIVKTVNQLPIVRWGLCAAVCLLLAAVAPGVARASSPWWHMASNARPARMAPEANGEVVVTAANLGDGAADGETSPIVIVDKLPAGFKPVAIRGIVGQSEGKPLPGSVVCSLASLTCSYAGRVPAFEQIEVRIKVQVLEGAESGVNEARVSGGGAPDAVVSRPLSVSEEPASFGVEDYELGFEEEGGVSDTQAGSHPFQFTTTLALNQAAGAQPVAMAKDLHFKLPAGVIGNPTPFAQCSLARFLTRVGGKDNECSPDTMVGIARIMFNEPTALGLVTAVVPVFNLEPAVGEPARFGFLLEFTPVYIDASVRTGGDYGVTASVSNISQAGGFLKNEVTFWGVPGDPRHDAQRGWGCLEEGLGETPVLPCKPLGQTDPPPFIALPTSCGQPLLTSVETDSWNEPYKALSFSGEPIGAMEGCNRLPFSPSIAVTPDGSAASTPTGLGVDVHVPQDSVLVPTGLAESAVKGIRVALPEGVALNPAGADGLQACSEGLVGFTGFAELQPRVETATFTPKLPEPLEAGVDFCPDASKVGTVRIKTPLLPNPLDGSVYLASQNENPFGSLIAMYIVAQDKQSGTLVKLSGSVALNTQTGRIESTFENNPQLAFEDAELHFFGGERAPLASPARCGSYTTEASFAPWSEEPGEAPHTATSRFDITSGPDETPCPGASLPFSPSLTGGTTSIQAGGFSPFTMTMSREDGQQSLRAISLHMPPGLSGLLAGVELCPEPQADQGLCGPNSQIGETTVSVGLGGDPFSVRGGKVYITGPYEGAAFGLSIVNPAKAGPFDLEKTSANHPACDCLVVRAKIEVDPVTAQLTVTSDNTGPYRIPTMLEGIPLQIKHVNVTINRPSFTFNPTDCNPMAITGSLSSAEGATSALSVPFQATNCAVLGFKPGFSVSTSGKTSRKTGASLHVKLTYPKAPFGSQANIRSVKVDLPKQLPSRLTTLQKACVDSTFNHDPALCPAASRVGVAKAITPLVPVPLEGPAYFVSHGGAKFPELIVVLQGYGVTIELHGETFIDKEGVTSSTFRTVPDAPVGSFELTLPQGPDSALAANGNLCALTKTVLVKRKVALRSNGHTRTVTRKVKSTIPAPLIMPTQFTAQNGMTIKQNTTIEVTGCAKQKTKAKKAGRRR
jgi:hypothetical protein